MTCLDNMPQCDGNPQHYYIWCNYVSNGLTYIPERNHTCHPESSRVHDNFIDCCLENENDCCVPSGSANPTASPTIAPTQFCMDNNDYFASREISCATFEKMNNDVTFIKDDKVFCCSINTGDCCNLNTDYVFIISSVMLSFIILICVVMRRAQRTISRVAPDGITLEMV